MGYATTGDLITRFGSDELTQITDRNGGGAMDVEMVRRALDDAAAEIDSYLAVRYRLPLATVPPVLVRVACDIARYLLWEERASEEVRRRYEDARRLLESISKGAADIGLPPENVPQSSMAAANTGNPPVFTRDMTGGF